MGRYRAGLMPRVIVKLLARIDTGVLQNWLRSLSDGVWGREAFPGVGVDMGWSGDPWGFIVGLYPKSGWNGKKMLSTACRISRARINPASFIFEKNE